jgi:UDP-GlcNAc:undecaprenyl-phosphate GlcNAc-1-phosphate transferase
MLMGGGLIFVAGVADDRKHLSHWVRFIVQVVACLVMVYWGDIYLVDFGRLFTSNVLALGPLYVFITIFAALGVINAFNMIDGMDGLSGGIFIVAAIGLTLYAGFAGAVNLHSLLLAAVASVLGFMLLNARFPWNTKARVFLGDSGSTLLGFILAWSFITLGSDLNESGHRAYMPMTAVWLIAVPLMDTSTLIWRRWRSGQSAFGADQHHLHHAFLRAGFSTVQAWAGIMLFAIALGVAGALFEASSLPDYLSFWSFLAVSYAYFRYMQRTWRIQRFLGRDFIYNDFDKE